MNQAHTNGGVPHPLFTPIPLQDFPVSWVGPHPSQPGFCFGSEDGMLLFTDERFARLLGPGKGSASGEAINGVAYSGHWIAVSTRADVTIGSLREDEGKKGVVGAPFGAHSIVAAPSGYFAAPMGRTGVMMLKAGSSPGDAVGVLTSDKEGMYFHRVIALPGRGGKDLLVCAAGQGGIGITELQWGEPTYTMRVATFAGLDVVDVCPVASDPKSPAVAAVSRDGTLILVGDVLHDSMPVNITFKAVQGVAYRVLRRGEDLYLLTSRALYVLKKLAARLAAGVSLGKVTTPIRVVPMEAVDASIIHDRWLFLVMPDEVLRGDVHVIEHVNAHDLVAGGGEVQEALPETLDRHWKIYGVSQKAQQLISVG